MYRADGGFRYREGEMATGDWSVSRTGLVTTGSLQGDFTEKQVPCGSKVSVLSDQNIDRGQDDLVGEVSISDQELT